MLPDEVSGVDNMWSEEEGGSHGTGATGNICPGRGLSGAHPLTPPCLHAPAIDRAGIFI